MNYIQFPSQYKKTLLAKKKNMTIRIGDEIGRYQVGKIYFAQSYAGRDWNIKLKIDSIRRTTFAEINNFNLHQSSIKRLQKENDLKAKEKIEIIKFKVCD